MKKEASHLTPFPDYSSKSNTSTNGSKCGIWTIYHIPPHKVFINSSNKISIESNFVYLIVNNGILCSLQ